MKTQGLFSKLRLKTTTHPQNKKNTDVTGNYSCFWQYGYWGFFLNSKHFFFFLSNKYNLLTLNKIKSVINRLIQQVENETNKQTNKKTTKGKGAVDNTKSEEMSRRESSENTEIMRNNEGTG